MSSISVDLPEPDTPVTATNSPSGMSTSRLRRLCSRRALDANHAMRLGRPARRRRRDLHLAAQELARDRRRIAHDLVDRADGDHLAAMLAGARAEIDDVIGGAHRLFVVLDDDHRVAEIAQLLERREQPRVVALMQSDRRLVEDVQHADEARADLRRQPNALRLAARERFGRAAEREVVESDVDEEAQPLAHFLENRAGDLRIEPGLAVAPHRNGLEELRAPRSPDTRRPRRCSCRAPSPRALRA